MLGAGHSAVEPHRLVRLLECAVPHAGRVGPAGPLSHLQPHLPTHRYHTRHHPLPTQSGRRESRPLTPCAGRPVTLRSGSRAAAEWRQHRRLLEVPEGSVGCAHSPSPSSHAAFADTALCAAVLQMRAVASSRSRPTGSSTAWRSRPRDRRLPWASERHATHSGAVHLTSCTRTAAQHTAACSTPASRDIYVSCCIEDIRAMHSGVRCCLSCSTTNTSAASHA